MLGRALTAGTDLRKCKLEIYSADGWRRNDVESILIGVPYNSNSTPSTTTDIVLKFIANVKLIYPHKNIIEYDERYTTKLAKYSMYIGGFSKKDKHKKENIDMISATILLQLFLKHYN